MQPNKIYKYIDKSDYTKPDDIASIAITKGEFEGVEFTFGVLRVNENEESATISFEYTIHDNEEIEKSPEVKERFEVLIGNILNDILHETLLEAEKRYLNEHRTKNSKASSE